MERVSRFAGISIATVFGVGYAPGAPGTWGTLVAVPIYLALSSLGTPFYIGALLAVVAAGTWAAGVAGKVFGEVDHRRIVIDEVAGYLVTMAAVSPSPAAVGAGFVLFRFFDIAKPFPVGWADRTIKNAFGVMADDLIAGAYALGGVVALKHLFPAFF